MNTLKIWGLYVLVAIALILGYVANQNDHKDVGAALNTAADNLYKQANQLAAQGDIQAAQAVAATAQAISPTLDVRVTDQPVSLTVITPTTAQ